MRSLSFIFTHTETTYEISLRETYYIFINYQKSDGKQYLIEGIFEFAKITSCIMRKMWEI